MVDWLSPELYLSQTCGLPYRAALHGQVQLIATPDNQISNCPPGYYCSVLLARKGATPNLAANDFTLAYNEPLSQSGWAAPQSIGLTGAKRLQTGGHAASARAVLQGQADLASVDALTWHFLTRDWDKASRVRDLRHHSCHANSALYYRIGRKRSRPACCSTASDSLNWSKRPANTPNI